MNPQGFATGHVRAPNKNHLQFLSSVKHRGLHAAMCAQAPPPSWDSRTMGWVPPIKDQGQCGSCWDFSGTGVAEIAYWKAGQQVILSEEYTLSCGSNGGCNGDDNTNVLDWAKKTGLAATADYGPYNASPGRCNFKSGMKLYKLDDWGFADGGQGQNVTPTPQIKVAIQQYGCVGCAVDAGFNDPGSGVISGRGNNIDHDVILVGWDDSKGNGGAWIMRNSWGTGWGNGGFAWIEYGAFSIGTEAVWAVVAGTGNVDYYV